MLTDIAIDLRAPGVSTVWLNDPDRRNAFGEGMMGRLADALEALSADAACRVILLRGRGGNFCAGRALPREGEVAPPNAASRRMADAQRLADAMLACPKPLVAYVEGWAVGVGVSLALWSDIAVAEAGARFATPEVRLGFPPTMTAVTLLRRARRGAAMEFLLTGRKFSASEALEAGVVAKVTRGVEAEAALDALTGELLLADPAAVASFKQLVRETDGLDLGAALAVAARTTLEAEGASAEQPRLASVRTGKSG